MSATDQQRIAMDDQFDGDGDNITDWANTGDLSLDALSSFIVQVTDKVSLLPRGTGTLDADYLSVLWALLADTPRTVIIDAGRGTDALALVDDTAIQRVLVMSACYQSVFRARRMHEDCADVLLITDPERAITITDVEKALARQPLFTFERTSSVGRMADAGLMLERGWRYADSLPETWLAPANGETPALVT